MPETAAVMQKRVAAVYAHSEAPTNGIENGTTRLAGRSIPMSFPP